MASLMVFFIMVWVRLVGTFTVLPKSCMLLSLAIPLCHLLFKVHSTCDPAHGHGPVHLASLEVRSFVLKTETLQLVLPVDARDDLYIVPLHRFDILVKIPWTFPGHDLFMDLL